MHESQKRIFLKLVVWQIIAIIITISILYIMIGNITNAFVWGLIDHSICLCVRYIYDLYWNTLSWELIEEQPSTLRESVV